MKLKLRPATIKDIAILKYWDKQEHILAARNLKVPDEDWDWEIELNRNFSWRELLIGDIDGRPVAFLQIIDTDLEETHYWGDSAPNQKAIDIWLGNKADTGKGYGTIFMQLALDRCFRNATTEKVLIDPLATNTAALRFYERLGFTFIEERRFGEDNCLVYAITRTEWEQQVVKEEAVECAGAIITRNGNYLLGKRSENASWYANVWDVFGGHTEKGETPFQTIVRELEEELSIVPLRYHLSDTLVYFEEKVQKKVIYHNFFVTEWQGTVQNCGAEHTEIRWFNREELSGLVLPAEEYLSIIDIWIGKNKNP